MVKINYIWKLLINTFPLFFWALCIIYNELVEYLDIIVTDNDVFAGILYTVAFLKVLFPAILIPFTAIVLNCILADNIPKFFGLTAFSFFIQILGVYVVTVLYFDTFTGTNCFFTILAVFFFDTIGIIVYLISYFIIKAVNSKKPAKHNNI